MAKPKRYIQEVNFWAMMQNVLIASINKGQGLLFCVFFIVAILIIKIPSDEAVVLIRDLLKTFSEYCAFGWVLFILMVLVFVITFKVLRRSHSNEMSRISSEKTKLQKERIPVKLGSSNTQTKK